MAFVVPLAAWLARRFELSRGAGAEGNLLAMEGLRGVAVTLVSGVHFATLAQTWIGTAWERNLPGVMHTVGHAGVDLFFVLSGFLIYGHLPGEIAVLSGRAPSRCAALRFRPLRWLGNMSYSCYLLHGLALHVFFLAVGDRLLSTHGFPGAVVILLVPAFIWTLIPAAALFLAVERPLSLATKSRRTSTATARVSS